MSRDALISLIAETVREYYASLHGEEPEVSAETRLFGTSGLLDSLGLVATLVEIEQRLADEHDLTVSLMDDRAVSQTRSPFRTPATLADYILSLEESDAS